VNLPTVASAGGFVLDSVLSGAGFGEELSILQWVRLPIAPKLFIF
jgi:hypothetical protein